MISIIVIDNITSNKRLAGSSDGLVDVSIQSGSRGRHARQSDFGKLGVRIGLVKKHRGKSHSNKNRKSIGKSKGKRTKKHKDRLESLVDKELTPRKNAYVTDNQEWGAEIEDEVGATLKMGQNLGIDFNTPDSLIL
ncbi:hypothetical protein V6N12_002669 [Hibiscus sabdariffa]|uniref:Uncharacterized protein n=1 Tax=Hibiscus sabdariffa TaxID=183260 RepID=A0ABR2E9P3_9ROSI